VLEGVESSPEALAGYAVRAVQALKQQDTESLLEGRVQWPQL
jgi:hypothetical protein